MRMITYDLIGKLCRGCGLWGCVLKARCPQAQGLGVCRSSWSGDWSGCGRDLHTEQLALPQPGEGRLAVVDGRDQLPSSAEPVLSPPCLPPLLLTRAGPSTLLGVTRAQHLVVRAGNEPSRSLKLVLHSLQTVRFKL